MTTWKKVSGGAATLICSLLAIACIGEDIVYLDAAGAGGRGGGGGTMSSAGGASASGGGVDSGGMGGAGGEASLEMVYYGWDTQLGTAGTLSTGVVYTRRIYVSKPTILTALGVYVGAPAGKVKLGLYNEYDGKPFARKMFGEVDTVDFDPNSGRLELPVAGLNLPADYYWLAIAVESSTTTWVGQGSSFLGCSDTLPYENAMANPTHNRCEPYIGIAFNIYIAGKA